MNPPKSLSGFWQWHPLLHLQPINFNLPLASSPVSWWNLRCFAAEVTPWSIFAIARPGAARCPHSHGGSKSLEGLLRGLEVSESIHLHPQIGWEIHGHPLSTEVFSFSFWQHEWTISSKPAKDEHLVWTMKDWTCIFQLDYPSRVMLYGSVSSPPICGAAVRQLFLQNYPIEPTVATIQTVQYGHHYWTTVFATTSN